jgi:hypothetical protein
MSAKRYAVLDASNVVVNHILINDPLPKGYWPGYGKTLLPLEPVDTSNGGGGLDIIKFDKWPIIPQIGDTVDLTTGTVTKYVTKLVVDEQSGATVAKAVDVKLSTDAQPKSDGGTITTKTSTVTDTKTLKGGVK